MNARGKKTVIFKILSRIIAYGLLMVLLYGLISRDAGQQVIGAQSKAPSQSACDCRIFEVL
jgi:hypothetical protein